MDLLKTYRRLRADGYKPAESRDHARTLAEFGLFEWDENADSPPVGTLRIRADAEQENYFDVYGKEDTEKAQRETERILEVFGCWCVFVEMWDGNTWQHVDSVGMCTGYDRPTDPFCNAYVIDLMSSGLSARSSLVRELSALAREWAAID